MMTLNRTRVFDKEIAMKLAKMLSLLCAALLMVPLPVQAAYPEKSVTIVVPFAPGGGNDRICRWLDTHATKAYGKSMVFEYKEGAGGLIGSAYLSKLSNDGYTLGNVNAPQIYLYAVKPGAAFKFEGLDYLFQMSTEPMALVVPKDSPIKTLQEYIDYCGKNPNKMSVGLASGFNSSAGYTAKMLQTSTGIKFNSVPLKGGADLTVNLLGKHVMSGIGNLSVVYNERKNLRFLAVTSAERDSFMPDVPTFKEQNVDVVDYVRRLIVAPAGVDPKLREEICAAYKKVFDSKEAQEEMLRNGWTASWMQGKELEDLLAKDFARFKSLYGHK